MFINCIQLLLLSTSIFIFCFFFFSWSNHPQLRNICVYVYRSFLSLHLCFFLTISSFFMRLFFWCLFFVFMRIPANDRFCGSILLFIQAMASPLLCGHGLGLRVTVDAVNAFSEKKINNPIIIVVVIVSIASHQHTKCLYHRKGKECCTIELMEPKWQLVSHCLDAVLILFRLRWWINLGIEMHAPAILTYAATIFSLFDANIIFTQWFWGENLENLFSIWKPIWFLCYRIQ